MFFENFKMALNSLVSHKMRSFLTMLGIIIGIGSVITIVSLGEGGKDSILSQFEQIGASTFTITVDSNEAENRDYITSEDISSIRKNISSVKYISPVLEMYGTIASNHASKTAVLGCGNEDLKHMTNIEIISGRFFNERDVAKANSVVVIDESTAKYLFGRSDVVGETVTVGSPQSSKKATIIGVVKSMMDTLGESGIEELDSQIPAIVYMPYTFAQNIYNNQKLSTVYVIAEDKDILEEVSINVVSYLEARHRNRGKELYNSKSMMTQLEQINAVMSIFTTFIATVAGISLLVGGIGIMNILLVSVTERTREIGIRKAIGAKTKVILGQFLTEAIILSLLGGVIGLTFGFAGAYILGSIANITPSISPGLVIGVLLFSSAVGLFFGIYPAKKAAKLDPIDALRYE